MAARIPKLSNDLALARSHSWLDAPLFQSEPLMSLHLVEGASRSSHSAKVTWPSKSGTSARKRFPNERPGRMIRALVPSTAMIAACLEP
jgi:hypothetical protein